MAFDFELRIRTGIKRSKRKKGEPGYYNECMSTSLKGRRYANRSEVKEAFTEASKSCSIRSKK